MADQEFSSPGEHMGYSDSVSYSEPYYDSSYNVYDYPGQYYGPGSSSDVGYGPESYEPNSGYGSSNVIYAPYGSGSAYSGGSRYDSDSAWYDRTRYQYELQNSATERSYQWSEYMSSTAMQRTIEDYKKAGINPILAIMKLGANAWTSVSTPSIQGANVSDISSSYSADVGLQGTRETNASKEEIAAADRIKDMTVAEMYNATSKICEYIKGEYSHLNVKERAEADKFIMYYENNQANLRHEAKINSDEKMNELTNAVDRENSIDTNRSNILRSCISCVGDVVKAIPYVLKFLG